MWLKIKKVNKIDNLRKNWLKVFVFEKNGKSKHFRNHQKVTQNLHGLNFDLKFSHSEPIIKNLKKFKIS